jgi:hypothetical protein
MTRFKTFIEDKKLKDNERLVAAGEMCKIFAKKMHEAGFECAICVPFEKANCCILNGYTKTMVIAAFEILISALKQESKLNALVHSAEFIERLKNYIEIEIIPETDE